VRNKSNADKQILSTIGGNIKLTKTPVVVPIITSGNITIVIP